MKRRALRVLRGGSYYYGARGQLTTDRYWVVPVSRNWGLGFRVVVVRRKP